MGRLRKNALAKVKKEEGAAEAAAEAAQAKREEDAAAQVRRKEKLVKPHASLAEMLKGGGANMSDGDSSDYDDDDGDCGLTPEEIAILSNPRQDGRIKPHADLTKLLHETAR